MQTLTSWRPDNIIEVDDMIELLTNFFNIPSEKFVAVGGMCGSPLLQTVLDCSTTYTSFKNVLIIDGCTDVVYMKQKLDKPMIVNHVPWRNLFVDFIGDDFVPYEPFSLQRRSSNKPIRKIMDTRFLDVYECIVVNNAHLIPKMYLDAFREYSRTKCVFMVDPFDEYGEWFSNVPTITRSFSKVPPIIGMARGVYGVSTDMIDRYAKGVITNGRIPRRTVGRMDDKIYVSNNEELVSEVRKRQMLRKIQRNQRFLITDDRMVMQLDNDLFRNHVGSGDIIIADTQSVLNVRNPYHIYNSKVRLYMNLKYKNESDKNRIFGPQDHHKTEVVPANILTVREAALHKNRSVVLVYENDTELSARNIYSMMKNSINLSICRVR